jgi:hypothetical protein
MNLHRYTRADLQKLSSNLCSEIRTYQKEIESLKATYNNIQSVLFESKNKSDESELFLDKLFLLKKDTLRKSFQWRKEILKIINSSDEFLNCNTIYIKLKVHHFPFLTDERESSKSISCALHNLYYKGKIGRFEDGDGLYYYGNIEKHFYKNNQPIMSYHKKNKQPIS